MKRLISVLVIISVIMSLLILPVSADTAGEKSLDFELGDYISITNGEYNGTTLKLLPNGKVVYRMYIPFNAANMVLRYITKEENANLKIQLENYEYNVNLTSQVSQTIKFEPHILKGDYRVIISSDTEIEFYYVTINREVVESAAITYDYETMPDFTEYEKAIQTAIILSKNSPVIMVNGGRRYVNNDNPREIPYSENGELFLPIHSFSRAFGYYYEVKEDEWVITREDYTFHYKDGVLKKQNYSSGAIEIDNITKKIDGTVYFPVKYFAALDGKVCEEKNGIHVIEYPSNARTILKEEIFSELSANYSKWQLEEKTGRTYYVSKECNSCDDNDGSYEKPFKTIAKAAEIAKAGDTVIIRGGTYHEVLAPQNNGTVSNPITFKAAENEKVVISANAELGEPVGKEGKKLIYNTITDLGYGKNQIFYKNENLNAGRHPNKDTAKVLTELPKDLPDIWPTRGNFFVSEKDENVLTSDTDLDQPEGYWNGATVISMHDYGYALNVAKVERSEPGKIVVTDKCLKWWRNNTHLYKTDYAYLTNHKNTVDMPGEWAIDDGKIYIIPPEGETADSLKLEQKVRQVIVDISDNKYIRIEGIDTLGGGMKLNDSEMCMLRDGEYKYISHYTHTMDQRDGYIDARDIYNKNGAPQRGEQGIYVGGRDNIIINNTLQYSAAAGIYSVGLYEYIENNYMSDCGYMGSYCGGLFISTRNWEAYNEPRGGNAIYSNTLERAGRHVYGISTNEDWYSAYGVPCFIPDEIAYNDFSDGSVAARDTAPMYMYGCVMGTERLKSRHHNNLVWNSWSNETGLNFLVYYDGMTSMAQFYDNIVFYDNTVECRDIFRQFVAGVHSITDVWGNSSLGHQEGGKKTITKNQYPRGKMFRSGASWLAEDKTPYLNTVDVKTDFINLDNAKTSQNSSIEGGLYKPTANGDWICFEDVDFSGESGDKNKLTLYFTGNPCDTGDKISVIIGESMDDYYVKETATIIAKQHYDWAVGISPEIRFGGISGKTNIYIRVDDYKSFNLEQIKLERAEDALANLKTGVYGDSGSIISGSATVGTIPEGEAHHKINNTTGGTVMEFKDVVIPTQCNELLMRISAWGTYAGQPVEVRIGSKNGEIIATQVNQKNNWDDLSVETTPLNRTLEAGTYDIYLVFQPVSGKSSNFMWFGFGQSENLQ